MVCIRGDGWNLECSASWSDVVQWLCCLLFMVCLWRVQVYRRAICSTHLAHVQLCHCLCHGRVWEDKKRGWAVLKTARNVRCIVSEKHWFGWIYRNHKMCFLPFYRPSPPQISTLFQWKFKRNHLSCDSTLSTCWPSARSQDWQQLGQAADD